MNFIDLHTHTNCSDAEVTLAQTLTAAEHLGISLLSVTDHNTVDAYFDLDGHRRLYSGKILPGVELSTVFHGEVIEILGYGIDVVHMKSFTDRHYLGFREKQIKAAKLDTLAMCRIGVCLDDAYVKAMTESPESLFDPSRETNRSYLLREIKRHPENAHFFKDEQEFQTINLQRFTRDYIYNTKSTLFSDQSSLYPDLETVLSAITESGGLSFLAHAFVYSENILHALDEIAACGVDGMECFYGTFTAEQKQFMRNYCDQKQLFQSGGSDHHGTVMRPQNPLGFSGGEKIPASLIEPWFARIEKTLL